MLDDETFNKIQAEMMSKKNDGSKRKAGAPIKKVKK